MPPISGNSASVRRPRPLTSAPPSKAKAAALLMLLPPCAPLSAQTFETLYSESAGDLEHPALMKGADGALYGTTKTGGTCGRGTIFRVPPGGKPVTLFSFNGLNGALPTGGLVADGEGNLHGATAEGGPEGGGTLFRLSPRGEFRTMVQNAVMPCGPLIRAADGNFYGTAGGDTFAIVRMTPQGDFTVLASAFARTDDLPGRIIRGRLLQAGDGNFYGVTEDGGQLYGGTVFRVTPAGAVTWLHSFPSRDSRGDSEPQYPQGPLVEMGGKLYGVTRQGGAENKGTVYSLTFSGERTVLASLDSPGGCLPTAGLSMGRDGNAYGTTSSGGPKGGGTVFRITPQGTISLAVSFSSGLWPAPPLDSPSGEVLDGGDGFFYGTCPQAIYRASPDGKVETVARFGQAPQGIRPSGNLTLEPGGTLLGTTVLGGAGGFGTVFRAGLSGEFNVVASFSGEYGRSGGGLLPMPDGTVFGASSRGDTGGGQGVFQLDASGALSKITTSHNCQSGLVPGGDGNLYGTSDEGPGLLFKVGPEGAAAAVIDYVDSNTGQTLALRGLTLRNSGGFIAAGSKSGAVPGFGAIYSLGMDGSFGTLAEFDGANGFNPASELVKGPDGAWYGTTMSSLLTNGGGTVYRWSPQTGISTLWNFKTPDPTSSAGPLIRDEAGNFWGTTAGGGAAGKGAVFRMTPGGELETIASFTGANGARPLAGLVRGPGGGYYGTASEGGEKGGGTVFKVTPDGALTALVSFGSPNGLSPRAGLTLGGDGNYYGTTFQGGTTGAGTVFRMTPGGALTTLYSFPFSSQKALGCPAAELTEGGDGALYGTASQGGGGHGSVFRITRDGVFSSLHEMAADGTEGITPLGRLVMDANGDFYGTASAGHSTAFSGSVFRITPAGALTTLAFFKTPTRDSPRAGLLLAKDGNLYGTTQGVLGGEERGSVFRITPAGEMAIVKELGIHDAAGIRGPAAALTEGADGFLYGASSPAFNVGAKIFRISTAGALEALASFTPVRDIAGNETVYPSGGLAAGPDGCLYGTTANGGRYARGSVFRLTLSGELTTLHSFDGGQAARPVGTPLFGPDGHLYGAAQQLSVWRLRMPPALMEGAAGITDGGAVLQAVLHPGGPDAPPVLLEYSTRPDMSGALRVSAGPPPEGAAVRRVSVPVSGLEPDTVYYVRAVGGTAENPVHGAVRSFTTLPALTGLPAWRQRFFGTSQDTGAAAGMADPDGDGLANLLEFALGGDPTASTPSPGRLLRDGAGWRFEYTRSVAAARDGVACRVQFSPDVSRSPGAWSTVTAAETVTAGQDGLETVTVSLPEASGGRGFVRIRAGPG